MDHVLSPINRKFTLVYIHNIIVFSNSFDEHLQHLDTVFQLVHNARLQLNFDKCVFVSREVEFLGHIVTKTGVRPNGANIAKVKNYPVPRNQTEIRGFLGLSGYYRKFIKDYSTIAEPLTQLLMKNKPFIWGNEQQLAFETLIIRLITDPILVRPDFSKDFTIYTDASDFGLGAVLSQNDDKGHERVIAYASRTLNSAERNYSPTSKEAYAVVWAVQHFHPYVLGKKFELVTDHRGLKWLFGRENPEGKVARWIEILQEYDYVINYRKGSTNQNADTLSRIPPQ